MNIQVNFHNRYAFGDFGNFYRISPLAASTTVLCTSLCYMRGYGWLGDGGRASFSIKIFNTVFLTL